MKKNEMETFDPVITWDFELKKAGYSALKDYFNLLINTFPKNYKIINILFFENDLKGTTNEYFFEKNNLKIEYLKNREIQNVENLKIKNILNSAKKILSNGKIVKFKIEIAINGEKTKKLKYRLSSINYEKAKSTRFNASVNNYYFHLKLIPKIEYKNFNSIIKIFNKEIIKKYGPDTMINSFKKEFVEKEADSLGFKESFFNDLK
ncbi:MAG: hypothetical protein PHG04_04450 [Candidatus Nanoarchaeia archaeon]|nr:hypothetical protein [Candidatus Nanoarchaeia archaeon]MDD5054593.1 hypothetical protein [Candidatus Nanoarchaeia archaeon]